MSLYEPLHWFTQRVSAHLPAWSTTRMVAQRMLYLLSLLALASLSRFPCWLCVLAGAWVWDEANSKLEQKDWVWRTRYSRFVHQRITRLQQQRTARLACDSDSSAPAPPVPPSPPVPPDTPPTASVPWSPVRRLNVNFRDIRTKRARYGRLPHNSMRDDEELSAHSNSATCASIPGRAQPTLPALFPGYSTPSFHRRSFGSRYAGFIPSKPCVSPPPVAAATSYSPSPACARTPVPVRTSPAHPVASPGYSTPSLPRRSFGSRSAAFAQSKSCARPTPVAATTPLQSSSRRQASSSAIKAPKLVDSRSSRMSTRTTPASVIAPSAKPGAHVSSPSPSHGYSTDPSPLSNASSSTTTTTHQLVWPSFLPRPPSSSSSSRPSTPTSPTSPIVKPNVPETNDEEKEVRALAFTATSVWPSFLPRPPSSSSSSRPSTPASTTSLIVEPNVPETNDEEKKPVDTARSPSVAPGPAECTKLPNHNIFGSVMPSWCLPINEPSTSIPTASQPATASSPVAAPTLSRKRTMQNFFFDMPITLRSPAGDRATSSSVAAPELFVEMDIDEREVEESKPVAAAPCALTAPASSTFTVLNIVDSPMPGVFPVSDEASSSANKSLDALIGTVTSSAELNMDEDTPVAAAPCAFTAPASSTSMVLEIVDSPMPGVFPVSDEAFSSANTSLDALVGTVTSSEELNMDEDMSVAAAPSTLTTPTPSTVSIPEFFDWPMPLASKVGEEAPSSTSITSAELAVEMDVDKRDAEENKAHAGFASLLHFHGAARPSFTAQTAAATPSALAAPAPSTKPAIPDFFSSTPPVTPLPVKQADRPAPAPSFKRLVPAATTTQPAAATPSALAAPAPSTKPAGSDFVRSTPPATPFPLKQTGGPATQSAATTPSTLAAPAPSTKPAGSDFVSSTPPATPLPVKQADRPAPAPSFKRLVSAASTPSTLAAPAPSTKPAGPDFVSSTPPATPSPLKQADDPATQPAASTPSTLAAPAPSTKPAGSDFPAASTPSTLAAPAPSTKPAGSDFVSSTPPATPLHVKQADGLATQPAVATPSPLPTPAPSTKPARSLPLTLSSTPEEDPWHAAVSAIEAGNNNSLPMSKRKIRALPPRASGPQHCHNEPEKPITDVVTTPHTSKSRATSKVMAARIAAATAYSSDSDSDSDLGLAPPSPTPSTKKKSSVALEHNASLDKSAATSNGGSSSSKLYSDPSAILKAIGQAAQEASQARANSNGGRSGSGLSSAAAAEMEASTSAALNRGVQAGQQAPQARVGNFAAQRLGRTGTSSSSSAAKK
ncbi:hypothetical protein JCM1840_006601 [Sporobolomyces johnsonii]